MPGCINKIDDKMERLPAQDPPLNSNQHATPTSPPQIPHAPAHPQHSSLFFSRLPYDCRLLIYCLAFHTPYTRLERHPHSPSLTPGRRHESASLEYDVFPYRLTSTSSNTPGRPLSLLLSCRQIYHEAVSVLYSTTTFIFSHPRDISCFLSLGPARGLGCLRSVVLAYGRVDWRANGPIYEYDGYALADWGNAFGGLAGLAEGGMVRRLEVWLSHRNHVAPDKARRPRDGCVDGGVEERHACLFEVLGRVRGVGEYTVRLSWNPVDVLEGREWPFRVVLMSADEMGRKKVEEGWPKSTGLELCD